MLCFFNKLGDSLQTNFAHCRKYASALLPDSVHASHFTSTLLLVLSSMEKAVDKESCFEFIHTTQPGESLCNCIIIRNTSLESFCFTSTYNRIKMGFEMTYYANYKVIHGPYSANICSTKYAKFFVKTLYRPQGKNK